MQRIAYLLDGHHVRCHRCLTEGSPLLEPVTSARVPVVLYREMFGSYWQTCHLCRDVLVEGQPNWPELYRWDPQSQAAQLWQVMVFGVTTERDGWTSTNGAPTFYVSACNVDNAWTIGKGVALQGHNIRQISGTVCKANILPDGRIDVDGSDYKSFNEEIGK